MRNWLKSLIADAVGQALATQHAATYNITTVNTDRAFAEALRLQKKRGAR